jgi:hypothetical protein
VVLTTCAPDLIRCFAGALQRKGCLNARFQPFFKPPPTSTEKLKHPFSVALSRYNPGTRFADEVEVGGWAKIDFIFIFISFAGRRSERV